MTTYRSTTMVLTRRQRNRRCVRSSLSLRSAVQETPVKVQVQGSSSNRKRSNGTNNHHTRQVALSQRSSLRRALRESLELLDESVRSTESIGSSTRPQRSSLRRAIRDSLAVIDTYGGSRAKSKSAPGPIAVEELGFETGPGGTCARHSPNPKARATSQRSSLRRAIRESRNSIVQEPVDTTSRGTCHCQTESSDGENGSAVSLEGEEPTIFSDTSKPLREEGTPSQMNRTSSVIPCTREPLTATAYKSVEISPPQLPELSLLAESPTYKPLLPTSKSFLNHVLVPNVNDESTWLKSTCHLASLDGGIRDSERHPSDSQSMPNQKGWHYVREIISEAPGGLFLVEWEERDARTGFKWPASWVCYFLML
ncbi:hypothetical protein F4679DRAFT_42067 [Xylaria curta]|nr:hypothetical protein F4679DRAFT_42067 [Xylaria curta]